MDEIKKMAKNHFSRSDLGSWGVFLGVVLVYKSALRILIREIPIVVEKNYSPWEGKILEQKQK